VHGFCNMSVLIGNGIQRKVEIVEGRTIEEYSAM
jgi:hypothetical protein